MIIDSSCELSSGGAAGYRSLYSGMVLESHCSKLSIFASLNSCRVGVGSYSLQDISFSRSSPWLEHGLGIVVLYVNASWNSLAASSSMSDSVSSLLAGAWAMGRTVSEAKLVVFGFACVSTCVPGRWVKVDVTMCGHKCVTSAALRSGVVVVQFCMAGVNRHY